MLDLIASLLVRGINLLFYVTPIQFNLWLGRQLGVIAYYLSGKRVRITHANLRSAFSGEKSPAEIKRITKNVYRNVSQTFTELLSMTKFDKKYVDKFVKVHNMERIEEASKNPNGMILVSAHFGNWELSTVTSAFKGFPLYMLARDQKMKRLNELLNLLRESKGNIVIRKGADVKNLFRVLRQGKGVGLLGDQNAGAQGKLVGFFGRPASTAIGPYRMAQKTGACILPAFIHRTKGPHHDLFLEPVIRVREADDLIHPMKEYSRLLEKHIRKSPDQWFWMHKRWKATPVRKIMVLDDGKKGHLKQSLAAVDELKRYRESEGYSPEDTQVDIVSVRFKNKTAKGSFNCASPFFSSRCQGCLKCLKMALSEESYNDLIKRYADVIISCGSTLFAVNMLLKIENNAKNLTVLDPGFLNRKKFDLVIIPKHDISGSLPDKKNIVTIDLAPNLIRPEEMISEDAQKKCVGLLFGGDNKYFAFGKELTKNVAIGIKKACERTGAFFFATTSRRTPSEAEAILLEELENDTRCKKFISGKSDKDECTVEKILKSSSAVIVSGESISMVSEAVSSGKPVLVFMPDKKTEKATKYEKFVKSLEKCGYLKIVSPESLPEEIALVTEGAARPKLPDDRKRIRDKMYRLF